MRYVYDKNKIDHLLYVWWKKYNDKVIGAKQILDLAYEDREFMDTLTRICHVGTSDLNVCIVGKMLAKLPPEMTRPHFELDSTRRSAGLTRQYFLRELEIPW